METLFHLLYRSEVPSDLSYSDLQEIVERAKDNNPKQGITSLLIQKDDFFLHLLEGEERKVKFLLSDILLDPQTQALKVLYEGPTLERYFKNEPMLFIDGDLSVNSSDSLDQLFELCMSPDKIKGQALFSLLEKIRDTILKKI